MKNGFVHEFPDNILHCTVLVSASVECRKFLLVQCKEKIYMMKFCIGNIRQNHLNISHIIRQVDHER